MDHSHGSCSIWFEVAHNIALSTIVCGTFTAITGLAFVVMCLCSVPSLAGRVYAPWGGTRSTSRIRLLALLSFLAGTDALNNFTTYLDLWTSGSTNFTSAQIWFLMSFVPFGMCLTITVAHRNSLIVVANPTWRKRFMAVVYFVCAAVFIFQEAVGIWNLAYLIQQNDPALWSSVSLLPSYAVVPMCAYPAIIVTGSLMSLRIAFTNSFLTIEAADSNSGGALSGGHGSAGKLSSTGELGSRSFTPDPAATAVSQSALTVPHKDELRGSSGLLAAASTHSLAAASTSTAALKVSTRSLAAAAPFVAQNRPPGLQVPVTSTFKVLTAVFIVDLLVMMVVLLWPTLIPIQPGTVLTATGVTALLAEISFETVLKRRRRRQARKGARVARVAQLRKPPTS
ncbi:hypothetical protein H9P43_006616 [Blastocladiella emersonii ATCC 22665]|nr:hypothetical protein H9P43_006616 [Blastocladiella emersonii ATCC 22665]